MEIGVDGQTGGGEPTKQATDWGWLILRKTWCSGDCPRATVVTVAPNKRQNTSLVDAAPSTARPNEYKALLI